MKSKKNDKKVKQLKPLTEQDLKYVSGGDGIPGVRGNGGGGGGCPSM
ncbi:MAG TPA: hypothetical protein VMZ28_21250 [Kofleriaceae bacterium]|nr:hypothetical protein [Kofleriaceae bacterium]